MQAVEFALQLMSSTPRADALSPYLDDGYVETRSDSGIGSRILLNDRLGKVVKLNEDRAYDCFVTYVRTQGGMHFPHIFEHTVYEESGVMGYWFTVTEMERLQPLTETESTKVAAWYSQACILGAAAEDLFGLLSTFLALQRQAQVCKCYLDMGKPDNYMARVAVNERVVVVTDPYF